MDPDYANGTLIYVSFDILHQLQLEHLLTFLNRRWFPDRSSSHFQRLWSSPAQALVTLANPLHCRLLRRTKAAQPFRFIGPARGAIRIPSGLSYIGRIRNFSELVAQCYFRSA